MYNIEYRIYNICLLNVCIIYMYIVYLIYVYKRCIQIIYILYIIYIQPNRRHLSPTLRGIVFLRPYWQVCIQHKNIVHALSLFIGSLYLVFSAMQVFALSEKLLLHPQAFRKPFMYKPWCSMMCAWGGRLKHESLILKGWLTWMTGYMNLRTNSANSRPSILEAGGMRAYTSSQHTKEPESTRAQIVSWETFFRDNKQLSGVRVCLLVTWRCDLFCILVFLMLNIRSIHKWGRDQQRVPKQQF